MNVQYYQLAPQANKARNIDTVISAIIPIAVSGILYVCAQHFNWWNWLTYVLLTYIIWKAINIPWTIFITTPIFFKTFRYGMTEEFLYIQYGIWTKTETVIPMTKIQSIELSQNIVAKKCGVRTIEVRTMNGDAAIPYIEQAKAIQLRNDICVLARLKELDD